MASQIECSSCNTMNPSTAAFCSKCGNSFRAVSSCNQCGAENAFMAKFCTSCGYDMGSEMNLGFGVVSDGRWTRDHGEFVRKVLPEDMEKVFGAQSNIHVPPGSIAVIMAEGAVKDVLPPGRQTTRNFFDGIRGFFSNITAGLSEMVIGGDATQNSAFYLIDLRPVPIPIVVQTAGADSSTRVNVQVLLDAKLNKDNHDQLALFLTNTVGSKESYSAKELHQLVKPHVERAAKAAVARWNGEEFYKAEIEIKNQLSVLTRDNGIDVSSLTVAPVSSITSVDVHLGTVQAPNLRFCVNQSCGAEMPATMMFCTTCGEKQPTLKSPDRACKSCGTDVPPNMAFCTNCGVPFREPTAEESALFTSDGTQVEVDLVLRCQGDGQTDQAMRDAIKGALSASARKYLRRVTFEEVCSEGGFQAIEDSIESEAEDALQTLGLRLVDINVLDVKSKTGEWLLSARSDMNRARENIMIGREWLEVEAEELDLQELSYELALRQKKIERDNELKLLRLHREGELEELRINTDFEFDKDSINLDDRVRRQELEDAHADLDVADANRDAQRDIGVDKANRLRDRTIQAEDHADSLTAEQQRNELGTLQADNQRAAESAQMDHEMNLENRALEHDRNRAREAAKLESEVGRLKIDDEIYGDKARSDLDYENRSRDLDLEDRTADREAARKAADEERRHQQEMEQMAAMAANTQAAQAGQQDHAQKMREMLAANAANLTAEQLMALQATELGNSEHGAAAFEAIGGRQRAADAERRQQEDREMFLQMQQQAREDAAANADRLAAAMSAGATQTQDALKQAAAQAQSMSEKAMESMSNVAATASERPDVHNVVTNLGGGKGGGGGNRSKAAEPVIENAPKAAAPAPEPPAPEPPAPEPPAPEPPPAEESKAAAEPSCISCGAELAPPYTFCGQCGTKQA